MKINLQVRGYRTFGHTNPLNIDLESGVTSFVGPNNIGKSNILKFFYEFRHLLSQLCNSQNLLGLLRNGNIQFGLNGTKDNLEVLNFGGDRSIEIGFKFSVSQDEIGKSYFLKELNLYIESIQNGQFQSVQIVSAVDSEGNTIPGTNLHMPNGLEDFTRLISFFGRTFYIGSVRHLLASGSGSSFDIGVGTNFINTWDSWKNGVNKGNAKAIINVTQRIKDILELESLEINKSSDGQYLTINLNGEPHRADEVGSGISQIVLILANLAISRPSMLLFDEPELNLHPAMQAKFLSAAAEYCSWGILFSTHSIGLARTVSDNIFSLSRSANGKLIVARLGAPMTLAVLAGELSFSALSELGASAILLVEGSTDIRLIQHFLRLLKKDHIVMIISMAGKNMIKKDSDLELLEIMRLGKSVYALVDSEKSSEEEETPRERIEFRECCTRHGINCHILDFRATENYLSDAAIKEVLGEKFNKLGKFESLSGTENRWPKSKNWLIASKMSFDDISGTDLGNFLKAI